MGGCCSSSAADADLTLPDDVVANGGSYFPPPTPLPVYPRAPCPTPVPQYTPSSSPPQQYPQQQQQQPMMMITPRSMLAPPSQPTPQPYYSPRPAYPTNPNNHPYYTPPASQPMTSARSRSAPLKAPREPQPATALSSARGQEQQQQSRIPRRPPAPAAPIPPQPLLQPSTAATQNHVPYSVSAETFAAASVVAPSHTHTGTVVAGTMMSSSPGRAAPARRGSKIRLPRRTDECSPQPSPRHRTYALPFSTEDASLRRDDTSLMMSVHEVHLQLSRTHDELPPHVVQWNH